MDECSIVERPPLGPSWLSCIERCPYFEVDLYTALYVVAADSILIREVSLIQSVLN